MSDTWGRAQVSLQGAGGARSPPNPPYSWVTGDAHIGEQSHTHTGISLLSQQLQVCKFRARAHRNDVLAEEAFDAPCPVADSKARAVGYVRP